MKNMIRQVLGSALGLVVATTALEANAQYAMTTAYGSPYQYGTYQYGQAYQGQSYQTSYYAQGYNGYNQGYQGYSGQTGYTGMGANFSYVDNNWIEDNLRFAVQDVNQNRPYQAMQKLQTMMSYVRQFGDSELYRRTALVASLGYRSSLTQEVNQLYSDFKAGNLRVGWESGSNQSFNGQDDISKDYVVAQLNSALADLNSSQQNRGRQRLQALVQAIPPLGNDRLIRRVYYAAGISTPSQMKSEIQSIVSEINAGTLVLNDTVNNPHNFYYGGAPMTSPYGMPDQNVYGTTQYTNGGGAIPTMGAGQYGQSGPYTTNPGTSLGYDTVNYTQGGIISQPAVVQPNDAYVAPVNTNPATPTTVAPAAPQVDVAQLKANVAQTYESLKKALAEGDRDKILSAQQAYKNAQTAYEQAKQ